MTKVLTVRVDDDLAGWCESYARQRGANRAQVHEAALREFRELCRGGTPDLPVRRGSGRREAPKSVEDAAPVSRLEELRAKAAANAERSRAERERRIAERGW